LDIIPDPSTATRFTDLGSPDANGYPHKYVKAAYDYGITYGTNATQTLFAPWNSIRRDQVVSMVVRGAESLYPGTLWDPSPGTLSLFDGVAEPHGENLRIAEYNGLLDDLIGMGPSWSTTADATRGEVAQILWNLLDLLEGAPVQPSDEVWVYPDGSGDYPTLEAAVAAVAPGATVYLGAGTFTLTSTLMVEYDLSLIGNAMQGPNSTTIRFAGDVIDIYRCAFYAEDIRFVSTATSSPSNVIVAYDADLGLRRCYLTGGSRLNDTKGAGLYLYGYSFGAVIDSVFTQNDLHGIDIEEASDLQIGNSVCSENVQSGICFWDESTGTITGCTCDSNGNDGIAAADAAEITIEDCTLSQNTKDGIALFGYSYGELIGNECSSNGEAGIYFADQSDGTAEDNECYDNHWGIYVGADSYPIIGSNNLHGNTYDLTYE
ncbi:MAG: right-handed parallel beta-helix repeat-containing protein, partial [Thermoleophilia bacterium]|nr:right-handed parallel beta-helix repeat-containing protein [Thermoleophilia bacterium]